MLSAAMLQAARAAADRENQTSGRRPLLIAVTVLTSLDGAALASVGVDRTPLDQATALAELARDNGCDGVVASPQETAAIRRACGPDFIIVTPGIRGGAAAKAGDDQVRRFCAQQPSASSVQSGCSSPLLTMLTRAAGTPSVTM